MKKILYISTSVLEILLYIAAFVLHYYTSTKMGMARHMIYLNGKWEAAYPIEIIQITTTALLIILVIVGTVLVFKQENKSLLLKGMCVVNVITTVCYIGMTYLQSTDAIKSYYSFCILFGITALIQSLKVMVSAKIA